jgi:hypothetical protein
MESSRCTREALSHRAGACWCARGCAGAAPLAPGIGLALLFAAQSAQATPFELEWTAPSECPNADFVKAEVEKVVGRPWQQLGQAWQTAQAQVTAEGGGYRLRVSVVTHAGAASQRDVLGASCTEATEAAVAILTAGMAPGEGQTEGAPAEPAASAPELTASAEPRATDGSDQPGPALSAERDAGLPIRPSLGARLGVDLGTLASAAPFVEVMGGLALARFELLASLGTTGKVLGEVQSSAAGAQMSLVMGRLSGCWQITVGNPALKGCGGAEIGSLAASGFGIAESRDGHAFWSAGVAEGALEWHITDASFASLGVSAVVPFRQLHVALPPADVHQTSALAVRPWLGLGLRFR